MSEDRALLPQASLAMLDDPNNHLIFSFVSIWEVVIKSSFKREDFSIELDLFRRALLGNGLQELHVAGSHAVAVASLPFIHKDPFDRLLIAQSTVEDITLLTSDRTVARYPGPIRLV